MKEVGLQKAQMGAANLVRQLSAQANLALLTMPWQMNLVAESMGNDILQWALNGLIAVTEAYFWP